MPAKWVLDGLLGLLQMLTTGDNSFIIGPAVVLGTNPDLSGDSVTFSDLGDVANTGYHPQDFQTGGWIIDGTSDTITMREPSGVTFDFDPSAGDETITVVGVATLGGPILWYYMMLDPPFVPNPLGDSLIVPLSLGADGLPLE